MDVAAGASNRPDRGRNSTHTNRTRDRASAGDAPSQIVRRPARYRYRYRYSRPAQIPRPIPSQDLLSHPSPMV